MINSEIQLQDFSRAEENIETALKYAPDSKELRELQQQVVASYIKHTTVEDVIQGVPNYPKSKFMNGNEAYIISCMLVHSL